MKNKISFLLLQMCSYYLCAQQVPLNGVIEHFTNTKCSACAYRNPDLLQNVRNNQFQYISIHPSAPYASCVLSQQNKTANDSRTGYYGIFGSTPRIVVNGVVVASSTDYSASSIFTPFKQLFSSFSMNISTINEGPDSLQYQVVIKKVDTSALSQAVLSGMVVEDTIWVNGGNGELSHYNVMRSNLQQVINLPVNSGDSVSIIISHKQQPFWNQNRIFPMAVLQHATTKSYLQTAKGNYNTLTTGLNDAYRVNTEINIYPNPASQVLYVNAPSSYHYQIHNQTGVLVLSGNLNPEKAIDINQLRQGVYLILLTNPLDNTQSSRKFIVH